MKIGIDIDNVISNFDDALLEEFLLQDKTLRNSGIVCEYKYITRGMFDWTENETKDFYNKNIERIATNLNLVKESKEYIDKLKKEGNKIIIITGRDNGEYLNPYQMTKDWLSRQNIYYDKLILTNAYKHHEKADICLEENIDIMIDDSIHVCEECLNKNINTVLFTTKFNKQEKSLKRASSWEEIYKHITNLNKVNIILDTDANNECDDLFALAYLLKSEDRLKINAVTIAPYSHSNDRNIKKGVDLSYKAVKDIFDLCNFESSNMIFKGSTDYFKNGYFEENNAIKRMAEIISDNDLTYILAIGAITNIAVLLKLYPTLKNKIKVIWLGGNSLYSDNKYEYNFKQDVEAVRFVYDANIDLTVIPCTGVADKLLTNIEELKKRLNIGGGLGKYLYERFYNDGYHSITEERVIWDISVIAYMINSNWFEMKKISSPNIDKNLIYIRTSNKNEISFAVELNSKEIYKDLFSKIGNYL